MRRSLGFTIVETMVGMVVGSIVMAGAYSLWKTHQVQGYRLSRKIDLRNELTLSSKKIQRAVTLAGLGLNQVVSLAKDDAVGSDTLSVFTNVNESKCGLLDDVSHWASSFRVASSSLFAAGGFIVLTDSAGGEARKILRVEGSTLTLSQHFSRDFHRNASTAYPATRQRFYTDQDSIKLLCENNGSVNLVADKVHNFQVSFRNKGGQATENAREVRAVTFSFTGVFPADQGALNSMVFSSTAIPRNVQ